MSISLSQIENPSEHVKERSKKMWTRTIAPDTFHVRPKEKGKARRVVKLVQTAAGIKIECRDKDTGESCPANAFKIPCSHVEAAINRLLINVKREANRKLKKQS